MTDPQRNMEQVEQIGVRLRKLRKECDMTLVEVAARSGISASTLSKVENDKVSPTFVNLLKLAEALNVPLARVIGFTDPEVQEAPRGLIAVTRRDEVVFTHTPNFDIGALCPSLKNKRMTPLFEKVHPADGDLARRLVSHRGEEFIYVLEGTVEVHTEYYQPIILTPGDSAYLDSRMAHTYCAPDGEEAWMIVVHLSPEGAEPEGPDEIVRALVKPGEQGFRPSESRMDSLQPERAMARERRG